MGCHALLQGNLPNPGIKPRSPALQAYSFPSEVSLVAQMVKNKIKINIFLKLLLKRLPRRRVQALDSRENTDSPMGFFFFFFFG